MKLTIPSKFLFAIFLSTLFIGCQTAETTSNSKAPPPSDGPISIGVWGDFIASGSLNEDPTVGESFSGYPFAVKNMSGSTSKGIRTISATVENLSDSTQSLAYKVFWYDGNETLLNPTGEWKTFSLADTKTISSTFPSYASSCNVVVKEKS